MIDNERYVDTRKLKRLGTGARPAPAVSWPYAIGGIMRAVVH